MRKFKIDPINQFCEIMEKGDQLDDKTLTELHSLLNQMLADFDKGGSSREMAGRMLTSLGLNKKRGRQEKTKEEDLEEVNIAINYSLLKKRHGSKEALDRIKRRYGISKSSLFDFYKKHESISNSIIRLLEGVEKYNRLANLSEQLSQGPIGFRPKSTLEELKFDSTILYVKPLTDSQRCELESVDKLDHMQLLDWWASNSIYENDEPVVFVGPSGDKIKISDLPAYIGSEFCSIILSIYQ